MHPNEKRQLKNAYKSKPALGAIYAITCSGNQHRIVKSTVDIAGIKSRYQFAISTKGCPDPALQSEWLQYGAESFSLAVLEELEMKEGQSGKEFADDIKELYSLWLDKPDDLD